MDGTLDIQVDSLLKNRSQRSELSSECQYNIWSPDSMDNIDVHGQMTHGSNINTASRGRIWVDYLGRVGVGVGQVNVRGVSAQRGGHPDA